MKIIFLQLFPPVKGDVRGVVSRFVGNYRTNMIFFLLKYSCILPSALIPLLLFNKGEYSLKIPSTLPISVQATPPLSPSPMPPEDCPESQSFSRLFPPPLLET